MTTLSIDIETYSDASLPDVGVYRYADDPSFEILLFAYAFDGEAVRVVDLAQGEKLPRRVIGALLDPAVTKSAFNAQFERVCLSRHLGRPLDPEGWHCTMIHAWSLGLSGGLAHVAKALNLPQDKQKMFIGKNLIRAFSVPRKPSEANGHVTRYRPYHRPLDWELFCDYCIQDVVVEREIHKRLSPYPMPEKELELYHLDQRINDYGVRLDPVFVRQAIAIDAACTEELTEELKALTRLENPNSNTQLRDWLSKMLGTEVRSIDKRAVAGMLDDAEGHPEVAQALELRQQLAKTSTAKYAKMADVICSDGRAHGLLQFYGARTGRWSGRLIQVQNLPKNHIAELDLAREVVRNGDRELLEMLYANAPAVLSQLIRTAFIPAEGYRFIVSDFSAIEARVIAWFAGEQWRLEVFQSHGKIYEASAAAMFGVPVESIDRGSPLRQKGKIAELALGYQGGVGALKQMGALDMGLTEEELPELVAQWRLANPAIVQFWRDVDAAAKTAISDQTTVPLQKGLRFIYEPGALFIELPSGRRLAYPNPRVEPHHKWEGRDKISFGDTGQNKRDRLDTYGGRLVENIVQATARDCLGEGMLRLYEAGYKITFHVHDEVVLEVPIGQGSVDEVNEIMSEPMPWAPGLPLAADGFECDYYQKD
ncbi:MAG: DNA polymerase [Oscillospiraceae bacterium]|jgi:DNA polymerase